MEPLKGEKMIWKNSSKSIFVFLLTAFLLVGFTSIVGAADEIKIGSLNDMTGATSDVGKDYALGIREAINYVNDEGRGHQREKKSNCSSSITVIVYRKP